MRTHIPFLSVLASAAFLLACDDAGNEPSIATDPVAPGLRADLAAGDPRGEVEIEVVVDVPGFTRAPLASLETSIAGDLDGTIRYTMNGAPATEAELERRATADRASIVQHLADVLAQRRSAVDAAIALAGAQEVVIDRSDRSFRVRAPRQRIATMLDQLDGLMLAAHYPPPVAERTDAALDTELDDIGVRPFGHNYGHRGQGVGIWQIEGNSPNPEQWPEIGGVDLLTSDTWERVGQGGRCRSNAECCSNNCIFSLGGNTCGAGCGSCLNANNACVPGTRNREHATMVALLAHRTAPDAQLYHTDGLDPGECMIDMSEVLAQSSPHIYTSTQSWSFEPLSDDGTYTKLGGTCMRDWDNFIASSRIAHFAASGNAGWTYVGHPGRAYNVMAVGNWNNATDLVNVGDGTTYSGSGYRDPKYGIEKPEVLAPGSSVGLAAGWAPTGSSVSAPIAAGFTADLMSGSAFFKNQPQTIRAYLVAGAHNAWGSAGFSGASGERDGAGVIDYLDTFFYRAGWAWASSSNSAFFDANQKIVRTTPVTAGKRYTAAIAWLADGDYAYHVTSGGGANTWWTTTDDDVNDPLDQKMSLRVQIGSVDVTSAISKNNFQLVEFVAPVSGNVTLTVQRTFNSGWGGVDLALTLGEHE